MIEIYFLLNERFLVKDVFPQQSDLGIQILSSYC